MPDTFYFVFHEQTVSALPDRRFPSAGFAVLPHRNIQLFWRIDYFFKHTDAVQYAPLGQNYHLTHQGILNSTFSFLGLKNPFIQFGLTIHNCICVFSLSAAPGYTSFPSSKTPLTESYPDIFISLWNS